MFGDHAALSRLVTSLGTIHSAAASLAYTTCPALPICHQQTARDLPPMLRDQCYATPTARLANSLQGSNLK